MRHNIQLACWPSRQVAMVIVVAVVGSIVAIVDRYEWRPERKVALRKHKLVLRPQPSRSSFRYARLSCAQLNLVP